MFGILGCKMGSKEETLAKIAAGEDAEYAVRDAAPAVQADKEVILAAVAKDPLAMKHAAAELQADVDVWTGKPFVELAMACWSDRSHVLAAVAQNGWALQHAADELRGDKEVVLAAVANNGYALRFAAEGLKGDREVVLAAVAQNGHALEDAAAGLKVDREVVLAANRSSGREGGGDVSWSLNSGGAKMVEASKLKSMKVAELREELKSRGLETVGVKAVLVERMEAALAAEAEFRQGQRSRTHSAPAAAAPPAEDEAPAAAEEAAAPARELMSVEQKKELAASNRPVPFWDGERFWGRPIGLSSTREQVLARVGEGWREALELANASNALRGDKEVVLAAVAKHGPALRHAAAGLKGDRNVVLAAVAQNGRALEYVAEELKGDREVVLAAVAQHTLALEHAAAELKGDKDFMLALGFGEAECAAFLEEQERVRQSATPLGKRIEALAGRDQAAFFKTLLRQGMRKLQKCKIVVLGSGTVGKTSLIKRLRDMPFDPLQNSTCGIDTYQVEAVTWKPREGGSIDGDEDDKVLFGGVAKELARVEKEEEEKRATTKAAAEAAAEAAEASVWRWPRSALAAVASAATAAVASVAGTSNEARPDLRHLQQAQVQAQVQAQRRVDQQRRLPSKTAATTTSAEAADQPPPKRARRAIVASKSASSGASVSQSVQPRSSLSGTSFMEKFAAAAADSVGEQQQGDDESPTAVVLDFAGQRMYYTQHHCELSDDLTLYVVAWSLDAEPSERLGGEDEHAKMSNLENLIYWLNSIHAQAPNAPVLVVATKSDLMDESTRARRVQQVQDTFEGRAFEGQIVNSDMICTSSLRDEDAGVAALRVAVAAELKPRDEESGTGITGFGAEVPLKWYNFLRLVREHEAAGKKRLPLDECRRIAVNECGFGEDDHGIKDRELLLMLKVFTDLGLLKHATLMNLQSIVVLDLQWIVDLMTELLCRRSIEDKTKKTRKLKAPWRRFRDTGRLQVELLPEVWRELDESERQIMLNYATEHGLCCELPPECGEQGLYVVPSLFPRRDSNAEDGWSELQPSDVEFRFAFIHSGEDSEWGDSTGFLPDSLYFRMVANLLQDARDVKDTCNNRLHHDRVELQGREDYMLQLEKQSAEQLPAVRVVVRAGRTDEAGQRVMKRISDLLDGLRSDFGVQFRLEVKWADPKRPGAAAGWHWADFVQERDEDAVAWLLPPPPPPPPAAAAAGGGAAAAAAGQGTKRPLALAAAPSAKAARVTINAPGQWSFFVSHTQRDGQAVAMAEAVSSGLTNLGHSCWLDVEMGRCDVAAMEEGVRGSDYFLAIVTDNGKDSYFSRDMCRQEIEWALDAGKKIVP
eukprot:SAG22_NODE_1405_length_4491_cov_3.141849_1_plen_1328_part_10